MIPLLTRIIPKRHDVWSMGRTLLRHPVGLRASFTTRSDNLDDLLKAHLGKPKLSVKEISEFISTSHGKDIVYKDEYRDFLRFASQQLSEIKDKEELFKVIKAGVRYNVRDMLFWHNLIAVILNNIQLLNVFERVNVIATLSDNKICQSMLPELAARIPRLHQDILKALPVMDGHAITQVLYMALQFDDKTLIGKAVDAFTAKFRSIEDVIKSTSSNVDDIGRISFIAFALKSKFQSIPPQILAEVSAKQLSPEVSWRGLSLIYNVYTSQSFNSSTAISQAGNVLLEKIRKDPIDFDSASSILTAITREGITSNHEVYKAILTSIEEQINSAGVSLLIEFDGRNILQFLHSVNKLRNVLQQDKELLDGFFVYFGNLIEEGNVVSRFNLDEMKELRALYSKQSDTLNNAKFQERLAQHLKLLELRSKHPLTQRMYTVNEDRELVEVEGPNARRK
eukprot:TRINITY_DN12551_c0_g1_i1.p1 TRINITY_DN12551_c0_g1~~TRINITY_DN12551_c0_g1_i1.p1  ORF type:complete len:453 (-),score=94.35 TRINITY_DN12551_c0_g1_i1:139-1497(-)